MRARVSGVTGLWMLLQVCGVRAGLVIGGVVTVLIVLAFHLVLRNRPAVAVA